MTYHNSITYTTAANDGMRYEQTAVLMREKPLTTTGAERILRKQNPERPSPRVARVQTTKWVAK